MAHSIDMKVSSLEQWTDVTQGLQVRASLEVAVEQIGKVAFSRISTICDVRKQVKKSFKYVELLKQKIQSEQAKIADHQDLIDQVQVLEDKIARSKTQLIQESNQLKALTDEKTSVQSRLHSLNKTLKEIPNKLESSVDNLMDLSSLIDEKEKRLGSIEGQLKSMKKKVKDCKLSQKAVLKINENGYTQKELIQEIKLLKREIQQLEKEKTKAENQVIKQNKSQIQDQNSQLSAQSKELLKQVQELEARQSQIGEEAEIAKANIDILERTLSRQKQELEKIDTQLVKIEKQEKRISRAQFKLSELEDRAQKIWEPARQILHMTQDYEKGTDLSALIQMINNKITQLQISEQIEVKGSKSPNEWLHAAASFLYYLSYILLVYVVGGSIAIALSPALLLGYLAHSLVKNQELSAN